MKSFALGFLLILPSCDGLPKDPEGTLDRIANTKQIKVGLVAGTSDHAEVGRLLDAIQRQTHARAKTLSGSSEDLLLDLADGKVDIVIGSFAQASPWKTEVAFGPTLKTFGSVKSPVEIKAAMQNGENRWIMLVERASRAVSPEAGAK